MSLECHLGGLTVKKTNGLYLVLSYKAAWIDFEGKPEPIRIVGNQKNSFKN